jgi:hypothetical protein
MTCLHIDVSMSTSSCRCLHVDVSKPMSRCPCLDVHVSMYLSRCPCLHDHVSMSMSLCLYFSMFPCLMSVSLCSMSPSPCLHVHVSKFLEFRKRKPAISVCLLQTVNGNVKLPFFRCNRKRKTEVCFPRSANNTCKR